MNPALADKLHTLSATAFTASKDRGYYHSIYSADEIPSGDSLNLKVMRDAEICERQIIGCAEGIELLLQHEAMARGL